MSNWMRVARMKRGLTLRAAAQELGISHSAIVKWEAGYTFPGPDKFVALQRVYGLGPSYIEDMAIKHYIKRARTRLAFRIRVYGKKGDTNGTKRRPA